MKNFMVVLVVVLVSLSVSLVQAGDAKELYLRAVANEAAAVTTVEKIKAAAIMAAAEVALLASGQPVSSGEVLAAKGAGKLMGLFGLK